MKKDSDVFLSKPCFFLCWQCWEFLFCAGPVFCYDGVLLFMLKLHSSSCCCCCCCCFLYANLASFFPLLMVQGTGCYGQATDLPPRIIRITILLRLSVSMFFLCLHGAHIEILRLLHGFVPSCLCCCSCASSLARCRSVVQASCKKLSLCTLGCACSASYCYP